MKKYIFAGLAIVGAWYVYKRFTGGSPLNGTSANKASGNALTGAPQ